MLLDIIFLATTFGATVFVGNWSPFIWSVILLVILRGCVFMVGWGEKPTKIRKNIILGVLLSPIVIGFISLTGIYKPILITILAFMLMHDFKVGWKSFSE